MNPLSVFYMLPSLIGSNLPPPLPKKGTTMLGKKGKDRITGFTGTITGHVNYISGCSQVLLTPPIGKDGKPGEALWFDEQRIELLNVKPIVLNNTHTPGPDAPAPKR